MIEIDMEMASLEIGSLSFLLLNKAIELLRVEILCCIA